MEFYFKVKNGKTHLIQEDGLIDIDHGPLKISGSKMKSDKLFGEKFELKEKNKLFSDRKCYEIKSSKGLRGLIEQKSKNHNRYVFKMK